MSEIHDILAPYLTEIKLDTPAHLVEALDYCGAVLGHWSLYGLSGNQLRRFMSKRTRSEAYVSFDVPKKSGGVRRISAPIEKLKQIQQTLNLMLQTICTVSPQATGFVHGRSIRTNAEAHVGQRVVINCDLKNFFPSVTKEMARSALSKSLKQYGISNEVLRYICNLVTVPREDGVEALPQGAPTSPVVSNLVLKSLDNRLAAYAEKHNLKYTRYADDITLSSAIYCDSKISGIIKTVTTIIESYGLTINAAKTKVYRSNERMEVTGLTVGDKVNVSRQYVKYLRTLLHLWESRGLEEAQTIFSRNLRHDGDTDLTKVVNGKINYLKMIKGDKDRTYRRFKRRYRKLIKQLKDKQDKKK